MTVPAHERILDLIIALTQSRGAMTREQIRRGVNGYTPDDGDPRTTAAFERMFERDKEMLKDLGVPLATVHGTGHFDDIRYRIDLDEYRLPEVSFTPAELGALAVASQAWEGSVLARHARRALTKLRGVTPNGQDLGFTPAVRMDGPDETLPDLFEALNARTPVRFTYVAASTGRESTRTVEPWQLSVKDHGWYLRGWDRDRGAGREFRLSRITSGIRSLDEAFIGPAPEVIDPEDSSIVARLALTPGAGAALRARGTLRGSDGERDILEVPVTDVVSFAGEIAALGPQAIVLAPEALQHRVIKKLQGAAAPGSLEGK